MRLDEWKVEGDEFIDYYHIELASASEQDRIVEIAQTAYFDPRTILVTQRNLNAKKTYGVTDALILSRFHPEHKHKYRISM